ncbi:hypothetical protein D9V41_08145 [Aeromicrobium phragmitis]|uniref:WXG100 family type VII secretion target n=1 Tax=Aeromicrobium phragmitis TaxID=2478914 RepID=A0A3L8PKV4_9ACTN|nr:hypothetical protein [Aeromicrobium phragmitis]RLV55870.1 hypothetical protein D9V41_08145 [Aeromicrobium phragmitis]
MAPTSAADYPNLGFDPTPGDVDEVNYLESTLRDVSGAMSEISSVLHGAADGDWRGQAAIAFRDMLDDDLRPKVDDAYESFSDAKRHVANWSIWLGIYQSRARSLESDAADAQQRIHTADSTLAGLPSAPPPGAEPPEDPAERSRLERQAEQRSTASSNRAAAVSDLEAAREAARTLQDEYLEKAEEIGRLFRDAIDAAPSEPGWLESAVDAIGDFFDEIGDFLADVMDQFVELLHEIAPLLDLIGDALGLVSSILGLLAFIPGLQFLALPALVLGGLSLLAHYGAAVGETGSFLEALTDPTVLMDAAGVALGVAGFGVARQLGRLGQHTGTLQNFFQIANGTVTEMDQGVMVWRLVQLKVDQATLFHTGFGAPGGVETVQEFVGGNVRDLTQAPVTR